MTSRPGSDRPTPEQDGDSNAASPGNTGAPGNIGAVERIVERFGGIRPMANKLDTPVTTVQGWKKRGAIPLARHADLRAAAAKHRIKIDEADLDAATPSEDRTVVEGTIPTTAPVDALIVPPAVTTPDASPADTIPGDAVPVAITPVEGAPILGEPTATDTPRLDPAVDAVTDPAAPKLDPEAPAVGGATSGTTTGGTIPLDATPATDAEPAAKSAADKDDGPSLYSTVYPATADDAAPAYTKPASAEPARIGTTTVPPASSYIDEPRSGAGFATSLSIVALLVGAAALAEPWWGPRLPGWPAASGAPAAVATPADPALRTQVQQLTERLARLEQRPAPAAAAPVVVNGTTPADPAAAPAAPGADTSGLEESLRQLAERIDGLEKRPVAPAEAPAPEPDPRVAELTERFGGIEQKLTAVAGNSQAAQDLRRDLDAVKQQVATVNQAVETRRDAATAAQALVLAAGQLRLALNAGQPFQQDLQAVRALGIGDAGVTQPLDAVAPFAAKGIPTQAQMIDRFRPLATEIVQAANRGPGTTWVDQVTGKLATLVTVRRQGGGVVGTSADAIVARAEAAVNENNLAKAVEELSTLQGPGSEVAAPWLADARARLAADQSGRQLTERAIALLTTAAGGKGAAQ